MHAPPGDDAPATPASAEGYAPFGKHPENLPRHLPAPPTRLAASAGVRIERVDLARRRDRQRQARGHQYFAR